jgi:glycosyltransferase involved in cell wall biosynthesis
MRTSAQERTRSCAYLGFVTVPSGFAHCVHILSMCDALVTAGYDTELLAYPNGAETASLDEIRARFGLKNTPRITWIPESRSRLGRIARTLTESYRAGRRHSQAYTRKALPALGALLGGAESVVLELHQTDMPRAERIAFGLARHSRRFRIVCISSPLARLIAEKYGLEESALIVEQTGHSLPIRYDYDAKSAESRRLVAMYVGSFAPVRGVGTVFQLAELHPGVDFIVIGGTVSSDRLPANVDVRDRVPHAEVSGLLSQADVLLMPYTRACQLPGGDGRAAQCWSPLKMFEYLSAGRSIIASDLPSIAEILTDESNCLLVSPESLDEWSAAFTRLASDSLLRTRLSRGAAETAEHHTLERRLGRIFGEVRSRQ